MSRLSASQIADIAMSTTDNHNGQRNIIDDLYLKQNHLLDGICALADTQRVNLTAIAIQRTGVKGQGDLFSFDAAAYSRDVESMIANVIINTHERPDLY